LQVQIGSKAVFHGPYTVSKAALNTQAVQWHNELNGHDFTVVPLHPGWVATDMGHLAGKGAMSVQKSAEGVLKITGGGKKKDSAIFLSLIGNYSTVGEGSTNNGGGRQDEESLIMTL
jgi:NAD(P)-dependent dehydrogenase (short-subunit alcohol dehydrogenase family)